MNRGSPRPPRPFYTPNNRQQSHPEEQRNTVNIPFYRDTSNRDTYNRNFGAPSPRHFHQNSNYNPQRRGGGGGFGGGGFQDNRRFNNNSHFTPRNNRPHFQRGGGGHGRENVDISQFYHPSMLQDPWEGLCEEREPQKNDDRRRDKGGGETLSSPTQKPFDDIAADCDDDENKTQLM